MLPDARRYSTPSSPIIAELHVSLSYYVDILHLLNTSSSINMYMYD